MNRSPAKARRWPPPLWRRMHMTKSTRPRTELEHPSWIPLGPNLAALVIASTARLAPDPDRRPWDGRNRTQVACIRFSAEPPVNRPSRFARRARGTPSHGTRHTAHAESTGNRVGQLTARMPRASWRAVAGALSAEAVSRKPWSDLAGPARPECRLDDVGVQSHTVPMI